MFLIDRNHGAIGPDDPTVALLLRTAEDVAQRLGFEDELIDIGFYDTDRLDAYGSIGITGFDPLKDRCVVGVALQGDASGDPLYQPNTSLVHELRHVYQQTALRRAGKNPDIEYAKQGGFGGDMGSYKENTFEADAQRFAAEYFGLDYAPPGTNSPGYETPSSLIKLDAMLREMLGDELGSVVATNLSSYASNRVTRVVSAFFCAYGRAMYPAFSVPVETLAQAYIEDAFEIRKGDRCLLDGVTPVTVVGIYDNAASVSQVGLSWVGNVSLSRLTPRPLLRHVDVVTPPSEPYHYALHHGLMHNVLGQGFTDELGMDMIAEIMSGVEWSPDTLEDIAELVIASGREISSPDARVWSNRLELVNQDASPKIQSLYREALAIYDLLKITADTTIEFVEAGTLTQRGYEGVYGLTDAGRQPIKVLVAAESDVDPLVVDPIKSRQIYMEDLVDDPRFTTAHEMRHVWQRSELTDSELESLTRRPALFGSYRSNPLEADASAWAIDYLKGRPLPANDLATVEFAPPMVFADEVTPGQHWPNRRMEFTEAQVMVLCDALNAYAAQVVTHEPENRDMDDPIRVFSIGVLQEIFDHQAAWSNRLQARADNGRHYFLEGDVIYRERESPIVAAYDSGVPLVRNANARVFDVFIFALDMGVWNELVAVQFADTMKDIERYGHLLD